ncbi:hypothetical protein PL263_02020 [Methylomonas sp. EFPC3]|uniref:hypothetical protein n=1 Tax=Methylomonas sp. EFPC3 TaxID=3021710 RepID=UPI0024169D7D|nr:hypothetical protein [Methylomonas sp. EFPC3]WFP50813.1 hypothetical protein PL263_02020 [Methylomonas sp. EFPC3]
MRHSLLLIAMLAVPAQVKPLNQPDPGLYGSFAAAPLQIPNLLPSPETVTSSRWLFPAALQGCQNATVPSELCKLVEWSAMDYPTLSQVAWTLMPSAGYGLAQAGFASTAAGHNIDADQTEAQNLSGLPLAAIAWFSLGCLLGSLAMLRHRQTRRAYAIA